MVFSILYCCKVVKDNLTVFRGSSKCKLARYRPVWVYPVSGSSSYNLTGPVCGDCTILGALSNLGIMGFRFRRRVRVLPGVYLNISRNGVSTTIGPRGASLNIGKQGVFLNTGIPGTGIYRRDRLFGGKPGQPDTQEGGGAAIPDPTEINSADITTSEGLQGVLDEIIRAYNDRVELQRELDAKEKVRHELTGKIERKENTFLGKLFTSETKIGTLRGEESELEDYIRELRQQLEDSAADINMYMDDEALERYMKVVEAFRVMATSDKVWDVTAELQHGMGNNSGIGKAVRRTDIQLNTLSLDYIRCSFPAMHFSNSNGAQLYIYPAFILVIKNDLTMSLVDLREFRPGFSHQFFVSDPGEYPPDAEVAERTWMHVNKDGGRDRRYSYNPERYILRYGIFNFQAKSGINERYQVSNYTKATDFANAFLDYLSCIVNPEALKPDEEMPSAVVTREVFGQVMDSVRLITAFLKKLESNRKFLLHASESIKFVNADQEDAGNSSEDGKSKYETLLIHDLMRCFMLFRNMEDMRSREAFAFLVLVFYRSTQKEISYPEHSNVYGQRFINVYLNFYNALKSELSKEVPDQQMFKLSDVLASFDRDLQEQYLANLYRFASLVVKADGKVTPDEEKALARIMKPGHSSPSQPVRESSSGQKPVSDAGAPPRVTEPDDDTDPMEELMALTGLTQVKESIRTLTNFIRVQQAREEKGMKAQQVSYHVVFTGNPGTGKTTVARLLAGVYKSLGVLKKGHLVETDRSGLIAEYAGQTAVKVNKVVDSALDGILFIDEAYALVGEGQDTFGREAVATLIKRIEDDRGRLIVILAGYSEEMMRFIESNPGFKSRFNRYMNFSDFTPDEMLGIFTGMCIRTDYILEDAAREKLKVIFNSAYQKRDRHFGNGRYVRNVFERTMEHQANRLAGVASLTHDLLRTITAEDIRD